MRYGFGVDVGGTTVKLGCFEGEGTLLDKWEIPTRTEKAGSQILPDIAASLRGYIVGNGLAREDVLGIGMGVPGPVRPDGTVNRCVNLGWGVLNVEKELERLTGFPVKAGNDASVAALGECWKGSGAGCDNMVFVTLGTGVGGGILAGGKLLHGTHGAAGEIGHMVCNPEETEFCNCGNRGCLEQYCSATGIVRLTKQFLSQSDAPSVLRDQKDITCKDVFGAAATGDAPAQEILEQVYAYLGKILANISNVTDPEAVVLGGGVSKAGKPLLEGVRRHFEKHVFYGANPDRFTLAALGNDAGIYGAFRLVQLACDME